MNITNKKNCVPETIVSFIENESNRILIVLDSSLLKVSIGWKSRFPLVKNWNDKVVVCFSFVRDILFLSSTAEIFFISPANICIKVAALGRKARKV